ARDPEGVGAVNTADRRGVARRDLRGPARPRPAGGSPAAGRSVGIRVERGRGPARCVDRCGRRSVTERPAAPSPAPAGMASMLSGEPPIVTVGAARLAEALIDQAVRPVTVDWRPPYPGTDDALARVYADDRRTAANTQAVSRMLAASASLVDVRPAGEVVPLERGQFCHAGPPIDWERASGPMRGALIGAMLLEEYASTPEEAERLLAAGRLADGTPITLTPCHERGGVGPMAGVVSPSMWAWVLRDEVHGNRSWCTLNEGLGKVLRYGAYSPEVIDRLRWMSAV